MRAGFAWAFPFAGAMNVGVGAWTPARRALRATYERYLEELIAAGYVAEEVKAGVRRIRPRAALLPPGGPPYRLTHGGVLYVGDAAGMIDPFGGEGIYGAVQSGRLAAEAAVAACNSRAAARTGRLPAAGAAGAHVGAQVRAGAGRACVASLLAAAAEGGVGAHGAARGGCHAESAGVPAPGQACTTGADYRLQSSTRSPGMPSKSPGLSVATRHPC